MKLKQLTQAIMAIGLISPIAVAQESQQKIQKVEVTGSSIKRTSTEGAASLQIISREEIERSGATTALGIITESPSTNISLSAATQGSGGFATGSSAVSMRGFGKVSTLVLVNGRRIASYGLSDNAQENFTNLDAIAADSIERVEILKDGASAIYGSDAVAGVINIILRKEYDGTQIKVGYRGAENFSDMRSRDVKAIFGFGNLETQSFTSYLAIEGLKRDGYTTGDLRSKYPEWHRLTPGRSTWDAKNTYSPGGNYFVSSNNIVATPDCPSGMIDAVDKQCKFDVLGLTGQATKGERYALASNTRFKLGANIDANFELTYATSYDSYIQPPLSTSSERSTTTKVIWYDVNGGKMVGPYTYPRLPVGHPYNPYKTPVELRARFMDTGDGFNSNTTRSDQYRAMFTLDGSVGKFDWKSAFGYMESEARKSSRALSYKGYTDAILNGTYQFGKTNSRELLETMFPMRSSFGQSSTAFIDALITGEVYQLPAGPISIATGIDVRHEEYQMKSDDRVLNGEMIGVFGLQAKDKRNLYSIFSEANIPLLKNVEMSAALRVDKSGAFDPHVSPKLGFKYTPTDSLILRATAAGGFRAPNIVESGNGRGRSSVSSALVDPRRCPVATELNNLVQTSKSATTGDKALANSYFQSDCEARVPSFVSSNPNLEPETSRSYTMGLVYAPSKKWSFAIDYFNIERKDEIDNRPTVDIVKGEATLPTGQLIRIDNTLSDNDFIALVKKYAPNTTSNFQNIGKLGIVYSPYVNSSKTRASGFDFDARTFFNIDTIGKLTLNLQGTYDLNHQTYSVADNSWQTNSRGTYDGGPRLEMKFTAGLASKNWDNAFIVKYQSGYSSNSIDSPNYCVTQKVAPENMATCLRIRESYVANYSLSYSGMKNTKLSMVIGNLFNADAPMNWRGGWTPNFRTYYVTAAYKF
jgi:iron complex outermembrane receptor protein